MSSPLPALLAQETDVAESLYSQGVQAYFDGNSAAADACLSRAIASNPNDPRSFYFRALSRLRQGRIDEARTDMQVGAECEARAPARFNIGNSLERIQGPSRLVLEQYRATARLNSAMNPLRKPVVEPDTAVLRVRQVVPLEEFSRPGQPRLFAAPEPVQPTVEPNSASSAKQSPTSTFIPAADSNPFGDDAAQKASPKSQSAQPPLPTAPTAPPAKASPSPTPPPEATPPAENLPAQDSNPFN